LAAQNYEDFSTAHSLFMIPVPDDDEIDHDAEIESRVYTRPEREELLLAADLIVWDEFPSNHKHCFGAAFKATKYFKDKVVLCVGDWKQIAPVVKNGTIDEVISAHIFTSVHWAQFKVFTFSKNLRLHDLQGQLDQAQSADEANRARDDIRRQHDYAAMLLEVGNGQDYSGNLVEKLGREDETSTDILCLPLLTKNIWMTMDEAIEAIHPYGFNPELMYNRAILATLNEKVRCNFIARLQFQI
jgi:hypothetical protein